MHDHNRLDDTTPLLELPSGVAIHYGPGNELLRHLVDQLLDSLKNHNDLGPAWLPLVLYGRSLCGKSLVAHGLAHAWKQHQPDQSIVLTTAIDLARSFKKKAVTDDMDRVSRQLRSTSLLVVDDIQLLAGKESIDSWFANLLDYRIRNRRPVIVTCNSSIPLCHLSVHLKSRLASGLAVCVALPRVARNEFLASARSLDFHWHDIDAHQPRSFESDSKLGSALERFTAEDATLDPEVLATKLIRTTAARFGAKVTDVKGPSRRKNTVLARAVAMFLIRELTPFSLTAIGKFFRRRDHTTVRHACEKIRSRMSGDQAIQDALAAICSSLDIPLPVDLRNDKCA